MTSHFGGGGGGFSYDPVHIDDYLAHYAHYDMTTTSFELFFFVRYMLCEMTVLCISAVSLVSRSIQQHEWPVQVA